MSRYLKASVLLFLLIHYGLAEDSGNCQITGYVREAGSGMALGYANLYIEELNRGVTSHEDGSFHILQLPAGTFHIQVFRVGYHSRTVHIELRQPKPYHLHIELQSNTMSTTPILILADSIAFSSTGTDLDLSGKSLRQNLGQTIAETINDEPGLSSRSMGPAPARPILRGLGGDRLLMLEDGQQSGDLSASSADHAVAIEPINSDRIQIVRGPQALLFGSNAIGGVIDVERNAIPDGKPHQAGGTLSLQGNSISRSAALAGKINVPLGNFAMHADGSLRSAQNLHTPLGNLTNTRLRTTSVAIGGGYYLAGGMTGLSLGLYRSAYGIPPLPAELGGHPGGVDIEMERRHLRLKGTLLQPWAGIQKLDLHYGFNRYYHSEAHSSGTNRDRTEFGLLSHQARMQVSLTQRSLFRNGIVGIWAQYRNYASAGLNFTPDTRQTSAAAYLHQGLQWGAVQLSLGLRYDLQLVSPQQKGYSTFLGGKIRNRNFGGFSGAAHLAWQFQSARLGYTVFRSLRLPGVEELYSEGPHLAAYAYEIGNPDLKPERGIGQEIYTELNMQTLEARLALFQNRFSGYIFPQNTGQRSVQRNDLFVYRYLGERAELFGVEGSAHWHFYRAWNIKSTVAFVRGRLPDSDGYIPRMPPLNWKLRLGYDHPRYHLALLINGAARQQRTGPFEEPTAGYTILTLQGGYNFTLGERFHTLSMSLDNVGNTTYYNHTNRVKQIMPEAGRGLRALYRVYL